MSPIGLEVPVFGGGAAAASAVEAGSSRIELNAAGSYPAGGLTPSLEDLRSVVASLNVPLRVMIRPRGPPSSVSSGVQGRDFIYSDEEIEQMHGDVAIFRDSGLLNADRGDGFVFGILTGQQQSTHQEGTHPAGLAHGHLSTVCEVDVARCTRLVEVARPFKTVFHRAFDEIVSCDGGSRDDKGRRLLWQKALDDLVRCGFDGILTSGGLGSAARNTESLTHILDEAGETGIEIIVGGSVRSKDIPELLQKLRLSQRKQPVFMHSSCLAPGETEHVDPLEVEGIVSQLR